MDIKENSFVTLNYKGTLDDGTVFDSSEGKQPLEFIFGLGMIIPGLEEGIKGLKKGDKKSVKVESAKAYGPVMPEAKQEVPKEQLPQEVELKVGMQLAAQGPQGVIPVTVAEIKDSTIVVDFNHPLAGKDLKFDIEVMDVRESNEEDMQKFMPTGGDQSHEGHSHEKGECCGGGHCDDHSKEKKEKGECCKDKSPKN